MLLCKRGNVRDWYCKIVTEESVAIQRRMMVCRMRKRKTREDKMLKAEERRMLRMKISERS